jgi:hypothetical protein
MEVVSSGCSATATDGGGLYVQTGSVLITHTFLPVTRLPAAGIIQLRRVSRGANRVGYP